MQDSATAREELQHAGAVPLCGLSFFHQCWPHHHDPQTHCSGKRISCRFGLSAWVVAVDAAGQVRSVWNFWNMLLHWIVMTVHRVIMTVTSLNHHDCSLNCHDCSLNHHDCCFTESSWRLLHWIIITVHWIIMTVTSLNCHDCSLHWIVMSVTSLNHHDRSLNCHECYFTESSWLFKLDLFYTSLCEINQVWTVMNAHLSLFLMDSFLFNCFYLRGQHVISLSSEPLDDTIFLTSNCKIIWHKYWQSF